MTEALEHCFYGFESRPYTWTPNTTIAWGPLARQFDAVAHSLGCTLRVKLSYLLCSPEAYLLVNSVSFVSKFVAGYDTQKHGYIYTQILLACFCPTRMTGNNI